MRFFHLADLHIGKKVNGYSMVDDQRVILKQVTDLIAQEKPDALILAGDIYDRRNPPIEAVSLFDDFVSEVVLDLKVPILAIGGNHDGGERLGFANAIQAKVGLHLVGSFTWPIPKVRFIDEFGPVDVYLMAYADLAVLHSVVPETEGLNYVEAMDWILTHTDVDEGVRNVLVAHGVVTGDDALVTSDSERVLSIGGTEYWKSASLSKFDYVALGHLHQHQRAGDERIRYAGSLMQYSFSEEKHQKVMLDVVLSEKKDFQFTPIPLEAPHKLVTIKGYLEDLLKVPATVKPYQEDYVRVVLEDSGSLIEPMQRLKNCYPNIMLLERQASLPVDVGVVAPIARKTAMSPAALFETFFEQVTENSADEEMCAIMKGIFEEVQKEEL